MKNLFFGLTAILFVSNYNTSLSATRSHECNPNGYIKIKNDPNTLKPIVYPNNNTWDTKNLCGDLLETYAKKPKDLEFIECNTSDHGQVVAEAIYRVSGEKSKEIEDFLVENYNMGSVAWDVVGFSNYGKNRGAGFFESEALKTIDPDMSMIITMGADGVVSDEANSIRLEKDKNKIEFFTVRVSLVII